MAGIALAQYGSGAAITAVLHPFGYAKVLMQIGHEPMECQLATSFLGKQSYYYGNILKYIGHIRKVDGFWGLYRGVFPRVIAGTLGNLVQFNVMDQFKVLKEKKAKAIHEGIEEDEEFVTWLKRFAKETSEETVGRCCGVIVSHPFHVIMVRCMVQFVGRETQYNTLISSVKEIYQNDGILGFFWGLVPRLVGEVLTIWLTGFCAQAINKYLVPDKDMKTYTSAAVGLVVSHFTYPLTLVTNIMACNNSGLKGGQPPLMPIYENWGSCMALMAQEGNLKRGSNAFWRTCKFPASVVGVSGYSR